MPAARRIAAGASCRNRSMSPIRRAFSSKPAAAACGGRTVGQTDRRTPNRYVDPPSNTMRAVSMRAASAHGQQGRDVHRPDWCCLLMSHFEYILDKTDRRTDGRTGRQTTPLYNFRIPYSFSHIATSRCTLAPPSEYDGMICAAAEILAIATIAVLTPFPAPVHSFAKSKYSLLQQYYGRRKTVAFC